MVLFDNLFYRMTRLFFKYDGKEGFSAIGYLSMVQLVWALVCFFELKRALTGTTRLEAWQGANGRVVLVVPVVVLLYLNHRRYRHAYERLHSRWQNETELQGFLRGLGALVLFLSPFGALAYFL